MLVRRGRHGTVHRLRVLRCPNLKQKKQSVPLKLSKKQLARATSEDTIVASATSESSRCNNNSSGASAIVHGLSEIALRNVALEAVRVGNYWAEPEQQPEVLDYISEVYRDLLENKKWLKKNDALINAANGLTNRYTVEDILTKRHEADGFNVYVEAEEACVAAEGEAASAAHSGDQDIVEGTTLVARKNTRKFASTTSWNKIGMVATGQHVEAADAPTIAEGYRMVAIKPEGAVELRYMERLTSDSNVPSSGKAEIEDLPDLGHLAELRDGLDAVIKAGSCESDPVGVDELLQLLEGCAKSGEIGAAAYCGERLEAMHRDGAHVQLPSEVLDRSFAALKSLLRPGAGKQKPDLRGPWSCPPAGRVGVPNPRKALGQLLNRLVAYRNERDLAVAGEEAHREREMAIAKERKLREITEALASILAQDTEAVACKRRGMLAEVVVRHFEKQGLTVSSGLAIVIIGEMEHLGVVKCQGRELEFCTANAASCNARSLALFKSDIEQLEDLAKERLGRRQKRQKAREKAKVAKRRRLDDDDD